MSRWYRVLVVFTVIAATFCTSTVVYALFNAWQLSCDQSMVFMNDTFEWNNGLYTVSGEFSDGMLAEMNIRRATISAP